MGNDPKSVIRRFYELSTAGDPACWELWEQNAISRPPPDFPGSDEAEGVAEIRRVFTTWGSVFGERWWDGLTLEGVIYTISDGKIVRAEHFMDRDLAREAAAT